MSAIGGPWEVSMPWPPALRDAGARLLVGERGSEPEAVGCGEKYEVAAGVRWLGEVELVSRRRRPWSVAGVEAVVEVVGTREMAAGSVLVLLCIWRRQGTRAAHPGQGGWLRRREHCLLTQHGRRASPQ
jgi:hypothetical protein